MLKPVSAIVFSLALLAQAQAPAAPAAPVLKGPADNAADVPVNVPFSWEASAGAVSYHIQVSTDLDFDPLVADADGLTVLNRNVGPLLNGKLYHWRVSARNAAGVSGWAVRAFTTIVAAPAAATPVFPADKSLDAALKPGLKWRKLAGATDYDVQVSKNEGFTTLVLDKSSVTDTTVAPAADLGFVTKYWWRVRGRNVGGTGAWSAAWTFTTVPEAPSVPGLVLPAADAVQVPLPVAFIWHKSDRGVAYHLQISSADAKTIVFDTVLTKGDTSLSLGHKVEYGTTYLWHVRAENAGGNSEYTTARKFSTLDEPAAPELKIPAVDSVDLPVGFTLVWHKAARAVNYKVQVSKNAGFTDLIVNDSGLTDTTLAIGPLANKTTYYWRVRGKNAAGPGLYSAARKFTTIILIAPPAPALASPSDAAAGVSPSPVLKWHPSLRAATYHLQVSLSPTFATLVTEDAADKDTTKAVGPLKNDEQYYWRVSAKNDAGVSVYSEIRSFSISAGAAAEPVPVKPEVNAVNLPKSFDLVWKKAQNAASYRVQVSLKEDFSTKVLDDSTVSDTALTVGPLVNGQAYFWRVRSQNSAGNSDYSDARKFTVVIEAPAAPSLVSPGDNAVDQKRSLTMRWNAMARAAGYRFQLSTTATFATVSVEDSSLVDTSKSLVDLQANTVFFWRVRAKNAGGVSAWSEIRSFKTEPLVGVVSHTMRAGEGFRVLPGSASAGTQLEFSVKKAGKVRFTVINPANGRAFDLVDRNMEAGTYRVPMGSQGRGRGVYFLSMSAGVFRQTQKVFLP